MEPCIVCKTPGAQRHAGVDKARFDCPRCGSFMLTGTAEVVITDKLDAVPIRRALMSHSIRRMQQTDESHLKPIGSNELDAFWRAGRLPNQQQQADNLILWIGDHQPTQLEPAAARACLIEAVVGLPIPPQGEGAALGWLDNQLKDLGLFQDKQVGGGLCRAEANIARLDTIRIPKKGQPNKQNSVHGDEI